MEVILSSKFGRSEIVSHPVYSVKLFATSFYCFVGRSPATDMMTSHKLAPYGTHSLVFVMSSIWNRYLIQIQTPWTKAIDVFLPPAQRSNSTQSSGSAEVVVTSSLGLDLCQCCVCCTIAWVWQSVGLYTCTCTCTASVTSEGLVFSHALQAWKVE